MLQEREGVKNRNAAGKDLYSTITSVDCHLIKRKKSWKFVLLISQCIVAGISHFLNAGQQGFFNALQKHFSP